MTDKTKMSNLESYVELSIQIATLDMKLNKILELLNKPELTIKPLKDSVDELFKELESSTHYDQTKPYGFDFEPMRSKIDKEIRSLFDAYKKVRK